MEEEKGKKSQRPAPARAEFELTSRKVGDRYIYRQTASECFLVKIRPPDDFAFLDFSVTCSVQPSPYTTRVYTYVYCSFKTQKILEE